MFLFFVSFFFFPYQWRAEPQDMAVEEDGELALVAEDGELAFDVFFFQVGFLGHTLDTVAHLIELDSVLQSGDVCFEDVLLQVDGLDVTRISVAQVHTILRLNEEKVHTILRDLQEDEIYPICAAANLSAKRAIISQQRRLNLQRRRSGELYIINVPRHTTQFLQGSGLLPVKVCDGQKTPGNRRAFRGTSCPGRQRNLGVIGCAYPDLCAEYGLLLSLCLRKCSSKSSTSRSLCSLKSSHCIAKPQTALQRQNDVSSMQDEHNLRAQLLYTQQQAVVSPRQDEHYLRAQLLCQNQSRSGPQRDRLRSSKSLMNFSAAGSTLRGGKFKPQAMHAFGTGQIHSLMHQGRRCV